MRKLAEEFLNDVLKSLVSAKVFTLKQLVSILSCSTPTARSKLKQWRAYTSYNHNGRYYALPTVPRFDKNGLWYYNAVSFSRYGNLKSTIVCLIDNSLSGLTGKEIGALVRLDPRSFLHHFRNVGGIQREKLEGIFVYFSDKADRYKEQCSRRLKQSIPAGLSLSDSDAVVILAALIKHQGLGVKDIMALQEIQMHKIPESTIHNFLDRQGLLKKTLDTKR